METGLPIPALHIRDISVFNVCPSSKNYPSAISASAAGVVYMDFDVFENNFFLNQFYNISFLSINTNCIQDERVCVRACVRFLTA
jgi:hypothetical protein